MIKPLTTTSPLARARRVVVKVGSALLVDDATGDIRAVWLESLCDDIAALRAEGAEVVIVTSGAIALGRTPLGLRDKVLRLEEKQAAAAAGQATLIHAYQDSLARHGIPVAQILLTLGDSEARRRFLNASNTLETLLKLGVVPVVNENDTVATQEIRYGDNDRLAARYARRKRWCCSRSTSTASIPPIRPPTPPPNTSPWSPRSTRALREWRASPRGTARAAW